LSENSNPEPTMKEVADKGSDIPNNKIVQNEGPEPAHSP